MTREQWRSTAILGASWAALAVLAGVAAYRAWWAGYREGQQDERVFGSRSMRLGRDK